LQIISESHHMPTSKIILFLAITALAPLTGCGADGPVTYPVSGKVTLAGEPIAEGEIVFRDAAGAEGSRGAKINAGTYAFESTAGAKRVEITAHRKINVPPSPSGEGGTNYEMYIPEKFNVKTELTAEVTAAGPNTFDFPLTP
jgi:predicted small lipoprotein YifL